MLRIFIGWDSRFPEPADVLAYRLRRRSSSPLDIRYLKLSETEFQRIAAQIEPANWPKDVSAGAHQSPITNQKFVKY